MNISATGKTIIDKLKIYRKLAVRITMGTSPNCRNDIKAFKIN
jgi:hypothetical protein